VITDSEDTSNLLSDPRFVIVPSAEVISSNPICALYRLMQATLYVGLCVRLYVCMYDDQGW